jgi:hypothetical protein
MAALSKEVQERIRGEIGCLSPVGSVEFIDDPAVVIYYQVPSMIGVQDHTDVLVPVPSGYAGSRIDLTFLPEGSPLIDKIKGAAQGIKEFHGRRWMQISYHPHDGGGGPPWNPNIHGFHTYYDEIIAWLARNK